jgi:hypothetical protein
VVEAGCVTGGRDDGVGSDGRRVGKQHSTLVESIDRVDNLHFARLNQVNEASVDDRNVALGKQSRG